MLHKCYLLILYTFVFSCYKNFTGNEAQRSQVICWSLKDSKWWSLNRELIFWRQLGGLFALSELPTTTLGAERMFWRRVQCWKLSPCFSLLPNEGCIPSVPSGSDCPCTGVRNPSLPQGPLLPDIWWASSTPVCPHPCPERWQGPGL